MTPTEITHDSLTNMGCENVDVAHNSSHYKLGEMRMEYSSDDGDIWIIGVSYKGVDIPIEPEAMPKLTHQVRLLYAAFTGKFIV